MAKVTAVSSWFHNGAAVTEVSALCGVWQTIQISPLLKPLADMSCAVPTIVPAFTAPAVNRESVSMQPLVKMWVSLLIFFSHLRPLAKYRLFLALVPESKQIFYFQVIDYCMHCRMHSVFNVLTYVN
jgi:hypothetical protein